MYYGYFFLRLTNHQFISLSFFFLMWTTFKVFIEFFIILLPFLGFMCFFFLICFSATKPVRSSLSDEGLRPHTLHWKAVLTAVLPGKS